MWPKSLEEFWKQLEEVFAENKEGKIEARYKWEFERMPDPPAKVLEVGCSSGKALSKLVEKGYECVGLDLPKSIANLENPNFETLQLNVDKLLFEPRWRGVFDVVICNEVIQHVVFDEVLLWQLWNALRERGDLFLTTIIRETGIGNVRVRTYKPKEILKLLKIIGFEVLEHEVHGDHIWIYAVKEGA